MEKTRCRNWCFTLNNWTEDEELFLTTPNKQIRYIIFGQEKGEKEETPHLQGFVIFHNQKEFHQVKKFFGDRYHIEKTRGTVEQNIAYCSKDEEFFENGDKPQGKGHRTDIEEVKKQVSEGVRLDIIVNNATSYQSARHAELLMKYKQPNFNRPPPKVFWFWGGTGTGKTRTALELAGTEDTWISGRDMKWWEGYYGQKKVIIDDFRGDFCKFHELLRILDRYPYRAEVKGGSVWVEFEEIYITTPLPPDETYKSKTTEDIGQLLRRITEVRQFGDRKLLKEIPTECVI